MKVYDLTLIVIKWLIFAYSQLNANDWEFFYSRVSKKLEDLNNDMKAEQVDT